MSEESVKPDHERGLYGKYHVERVDGVARNGDHLCECGHRRTAHWTEGCRAYPGPCDCRLYKRRDESHLLAASKG
jgi:hypothetical protein